MKKKQAIKNIFTIIIGVFLLSTTVQAAPKISGKYELVGDIEKLKNVKKIELREFFNFSCGHCYKFLKTSKRLEKKYKKKLTHTYKPIFWGKQTPYPAMLYLIAKDNGKKDIAKHEIFNAKFEMGIDIFDYRMINFIASSIGVGEQFEKESRGRRLKKRVDRIQKQANKFGISQTPTIIINGVIKVNPSMTDGDIERMTDNIDRIIEDILKY